MSAPFPDQTPAPAMPDCFVAGAYYPLWLASVAGRVGWMAKQQLCASRCFAVKLATHTGQIIRKWRAAESGRISRKSMSKTAEWNKRAS